MVGSFAWRCWRRRWSEVAPTTGAQVSGRAAEARSGLFPPSWNCRSSARGGSGCERLRGTGAPGHTHRALWPAHRRASSCRRSHACYKERPRVPAFQRGENGIVAVSTRHEARPLFPHVGRGQVDRRAAGGEVEPGIDERGHHPVAGFSDGGVRKADNDDDGVAIPGVTAANRLLARARLRQSSAMNETGFCSHREGAELCHQTGKKGDPALTESPPNQLWYEAPLGFITFIKRSIFRACSFRPGLQSK